MESRYKEFAMTLYKSRNCPGLAEKVPHTLYLSYDELSVALDSKPKRRNYEEESITTRIRHICYEFNGIIM